MIERASKEALFNDYPPVIVYDSCLIFSLIFPFNTVKKEFFLKTL